MNAYRSGTEVDDFFAFSYSLDNSVFTPMLVVSALDAGLEAYVFQEDVSGTVYVRVQDTDNTPGNSQLDSLFVDFLAIATMTGGGSVTAPVVTIGAPLGGSTFTEGDSISFAGTATDAEDGDISTSLSWTSNTDVVIFSGASFSTSSLSVGAHTITASVTDSGGLPGADSIPITVMGGGSRCFRQPNARSRAFNTST